MHSAEHDALAAAGRTTDVMARILEDFRVLEAEELGLRNRETPASALVSTRVG